MSLESVGRGQLSVKDLALQELKKERATEAKDKLKVLYKKQIQAKQVLANIEREIADYMLELDTQEQDVSR